MDAAASTWVPAVAVLGTASLAAMGYLWRTRRASASDSAAGTDDPMPETLQRRVEQLMEQLRELETDQHLLAPETLAAERERLEAEAATALRARDTYQPRAPANPPSPAAPGGGLLAQHPQLKGALWGGGVVLFFVLLGLYVSSDNTPRADRPATGQAPPMGAEAQASASDRELDALQEHLQEFPDDVESTARAAHLLLRRQDTADAELLTLRGLVIDPFHTETLIHRALLRAAKGEAPAAEKELARLAETYPRAHEALLYLGMLRLQRGDKRSALEAFERYQKAAPSGEQPPMLGGTLSSLRAELQGGNPTP